jgi:hypothetical protein
MDAPDPLIPIGERAVKLEEGKGAVLPGLSSEEAARLLALNGPNEVAVKHHNLLLQ